MQPQIIIGKFLSALKAGDVEAATDFVAEDAAFVGVRPDPKPSVPPYGTYIGRDGLEAFFSALARTFSKQSLTVEHVGEGENVAFASGRLDHVVAATGNLSPAIGCCAAGCVTARLHITSFVKTALGWKKRFRLTRRRHEDR